MKNASGKYTAIIDGDMQQNPKYLIEMYDFLEKNKEYDQVCMLPNKRKNMSLVKRIGGHLFYKLMNRLSTIKFTEDASDFRMFNTSVKEAVLSLSENNRFSKGIFNWVGFNTKSMIYDVEPRLYGKTKFNFKRSVNYALIGIIDYAENPLNIFAKLGLINLFGGFVLLIYLVIKSIILNELYMKFYLLLAIIFILAGIIMLGISFICLYLSRMQVEIKKRPIYIIKKIQEK
jgi:glycosyltransferase involved in cell wall biosynthesis